MPYVRRRLCFKPDVNAMPYVGQRYPYKCENRVPTAISDSTNPYKCENRVPIAISDSTNLYPDHTKNGNS